MKNSNELSIHSRCDIDGMRWIGGGVFDMGSEEFYPEERPVRSVKVEGFWMDVTPVTNGEFKKFVNETGYITVAERVPLPEDYPGVESELLIPGSLVFRSPSADSIVHGPDDWWFYVPGACWHKPDGVLALQPDDVYKPVVQVCYEDALAFATWNGKRLPTESEWEFAARGGMQNKDYAWGDTFLPGGRILANTWEGNFPFKDDMKTSAFYGTSPVGTFPANPYGLFDMIGNVWEWTSDQWMLNYATSQKKCCLSETNKKKMFEKKVLKGGSHLCASNYCHRYRPAARIAQMTDSATSHIGFRCAKDYPIIE